MGLGFNLRAHVGCAVFREPLAGLKAKLSCRRSPDVSVSSSAALMGLDWRADAQRRESDVPF